MMKKGWLVLLAVVLVFGFAVLGCSGGEEGGSDSPSKEAHYPTIDLRINRWVDDQGVKHEQWTSGNQVKLSDITADRPKKGDILKFKISGTSDKLLDNISLEICQVIGENWSTFKWLGGSHIGACPLSFNLTTSIEIKEDPNTNSKAYYFIQLTNAVASPTDIAQSTVMATISNFTIGILGDDDGNDDDDYYTASPDESPDSPGSGGGG